MAPRKPNNSKKGGDSKRRKKDEGPTPASVLRAIERSLRGETKEPVPRPAGATRDEFKDTRCMKRLRRRGIVRCLAPKADSHLRNNSTSYKEANSGYQRGELAREPCEQCENGDGTQAECVVVPGEFGGACSNCRYDRDTKKCSFWRPKKGKKGGKGKAKKGAEKKKGGAKKGGKKGKKVDDGDSDSDVDDNTEEENDNDSDDDYVGDDDDDDEGGQDGTPFWGKGGRDDDDAVGGDDGDAGALFVPQQVAAY